MIVDRGINARQVARQLNIPYTTVSEWARKYRLGGAQAERISSLFARSVEYAYRNRSTAQYVADLYDALMRRGADWAGMQYWIGQIDSGALSREQVSRQFLLSTEFTNRVNGITAQGCLP